MLAVALAAAATMAGAAAKAPVAPFEVADGYAAHNLIDAHVLKAQRERGITPAYLCSDEVFIRRAYLDIIGTVPEPMDVRRFLLDRNPQKRAALIDALLERPEFVDYWSMKWSDILRVKAEFPINLWPNAVQAYSRFIHDAIRDNMRYDEMARRMLTSSGSNFRDPEVNFYRALQGRRPEDIAGAVALTFMGERVAGMSEQERENLAAFFARVAYKSTGEWKEEIVYADPNATEPLNVTFPDGTTATIAPDQDPRQVFADWLTAPDNPWFARAIANRVWFWLLGRGIVQEPDDMRSGNPPSNEALLAYLAQELVDSGYDLRHLYRLILNSRTYQQSSIPATEGEEAEAQFAYYIVRPLEAEVLVDALAWLGGPKESYQSPIPEPFTFIPDDQRVIDLEDGSITSSTLETFGRPPRDTGLLLERGTQPTDAQRLYMLNSTDVQRIVERSARLRALPAVSRGKAANLIGLVYLTILSRMPTPDEITAAQGYAQTAKLNQKQAVEDLAWALLNTKEFLYRH
jgi:hypothetical protein